MKLKGDKKDEDKSSILSNVSCQNNLNKMFHFVTNEMQTKRSKTHHFSPEIVVEIVDQNGNLRPIRCLLDTGTSASILLKQYVRRGCSKTKKSESVKWTTMGGTFETSRKALVEFSLPEFTTRKKITHLVHVDERTNPQDSSYDMILGMDILTKLHIVMDLEQKDHSLERT